MWGLFRKKKVGLVLGGGGARGFFHIGVIKGLQELEIRPDEIAGTSIGAVVGAMWSSDPDLDIVETATRLDFLKLIRMTVWGSKHADSDEIGTYLRQFVRASSFSELKIPLKFTATDINARRQTVFRSGDLFPALVASVSIPGVFPPVHYMDKYLVDGGVIDNVPGSLIPDASSLIVSDICGPFKKVDSHSARVDILYSSIALLQQKYGLEKIAAMKDTNVIYLPLLDDEVSILDFRKQNFQKLIGMGYDAVMAKRNRLVAACSSTRAAPTANARV